MGRDRGGLRNDRREDHRGYHGGRNDRGRGDSRDRNGAPSRDRGREWDVGKDRGRDRGGSRDRRGGGHRDYVRDDRNGRDDAPGRGAVEDAMVVEKPGTSRATQQPEMTLEEERLYQQRITAAMQAMEEEEEYEDDVAKAKRVAEERRKRREEIMRKHALAKENKNENEKAIEKKPSPQTSSMKPAVPVSSVPKEHAEKPTAPVSDMFAEDAEFDDEAGERDAARANRLSGKLAEKNGAVDMSSGLADNWDDADGYYRARVGEVLDGRYRVLDTHGRGVFSTVVKAKDEDFVEGDGAGTSGNQFSEVAIKVIRANDTMYKAAQLEITILKKLMATDLDDTKHIVRFTRTFEFRDHVFMVFESMHANLREVLKKYGRDVGINIKGVRSYTIQMLTALKHLETCGVVHADIKPDNVLVNAKNSNLQLCDFGSAMFDGNNELTPYLQSRFYRAPEVILGLKYSFPLDMWSVGCCLFELYTGKMAFPGKSNNDMLRLFIETKGPLPRKLLRKAAFKEQHYDDDGLFSSVSVDQVTKQQIRRTIRDSKPLRDIHQRVGARARRDTHLTGEERKMTTALGDLLDKIFTYDPDKRITPANALLHPFCQ